MKAILWLAGTQVTAYRMEGGEGNDDMSGDDPGADLACWFTRGWKFHAGLPSNANGATVLVLRDGRPLDTKPDL